LAAKLRKNERNAKEKLVFLFISECQVSSANTKVTKNRAQNKETGFFFCRDGVSSPSLMAKVRKKLVKAKRFWKINAIRPEIKARRGRMRKSKLGQKANWGALVKELGFLFVTHFKPIVR
jgi:hypothetical protein